MKSLVLDQLPQGWAICRFDEIIHSYSGNSKLIKGRLHASFAQGRFLGFSASGGDVWLDHYEEEGPAIILSAVGARCGKCFLANGKWSAIANTHVLRTNEALIETKFLWYLLNDELFWIRGGSGQPFVRTKESLTRKFAIPPLSEQRRIVAKIEELFSEIDKCIESLTTAREQLKAYRQSILKAAFEGKLTVRNASDGGSFSEKPLGAFLKFLTSGSRGWADYYAEHGHTFIRAQNLKYDRLDLSDRAYVQIPEDNTEGVRTRVCYGDVLVTITGANVTRTGIINKDLGVAYVSQHVALCRTTDELLPEFLYWYLVSDTGGRKQLNAFAYGAGKPGLNLNNIRQVKIPVPPLQAQKAIVSRISELLDSEQKMSAAIKEAFISAASLRQSILKRAFSGQLVPQVANEEPASVLLDRIRTEKRSSPRKNRSEAHV
jgi:type I restriction enzyme S subunit